MAPRDVRREHDRILQRLTLQLKRKGFRDIEADIKGFPKPGTLVVDPGDEYVPDAIGLGKEFHLFEVETPETLQAPPTERKWPAFAEYAKRRKGTFCLVVPPGAAPAARRRLEALMVSARVWEV